MSEVIETRIATVWLRDDGILRSVKKPGAEDTLDDAVEQEAAIQKVIEGKRRPLLLDMRGQRFVSREAREYYIRSGSRSMFVAIAGLVGSPVSRIIGNFMLRFHRTDLPVKLFTSEADAIEWLKEFIK